MSRDLPEALELHLVVYRAANGFAVDFPVRAQVKLPKDNSVEEWREDSESNSFFTVFFVTNLYISHKDAIADIARFLEKDLLPEAVVKEAKRIAEEEN